MAGSDNSRPATGYDVPPEILPDTAGGDPSASGRYEVPETHDAQPDSGGGNGVRRGMMGAAALTAASLVAAWVWRKRRSRSRMQRLRDTMGRTAKQVRSQGRRSTIQAGKQARKAGVQVGKQARTAGMQAGSKAGKAAGKVAGKAAGKAKDRIGFLR